MQTATTADDEVLLQIALESAHETRALLVDAGARRRAPDVFASQFGQAQAIVVADANTFEAAGRDVADSFRRAAHPSAEPFVFADRHIYAEWKFVEELEAALSRCNAIPVAVGSGTINDLVKLVSHRLGRPYMAAATAASMDGYTAYGASITFQGSKQTFDCPAPRAVVADLDVIAAAPEGMNASGYADLLAKMAAGADWLAAAAAGAEPVQARVWEMVQGPLRRWVEDPRGVRERQPLPLRRLLNGLLVSGFAMQAARSSRPASGAEHQFSHLWDMQHHQHNGEPPSHGFKVGIGTLASLALYENLLASGEFPAGETANWPPLETWEAQIRTCFDDPALRSVALKETRAKYAPAEAVREETRKLRAAWSEMRPALLRQVLSFQEAQSRLREAGCPWQPEQIGISRARLRASYLQAFFIRRRYTVLDMAMRAGVFESALERLFSAAGAWGHPGGGGA